MATPQAHSPPTSPELSERASLPLSAILAVTLNCNARCVMCDIWQNDMHGEVGPEVFRRLPSSLRDINVSGGEPFLRPDLPEIVRNIKIAAPRARLVISTNGFTPGRIERSVREILEVDPGVGLRISIDGYGEKHDQVRGIPRGFRKCMDTLERFRKLGVRDLGLGFTVLRQNVEDLSRVYDLTRREGIEFTVSLPASSSIYFGEGKEEMGPDPEALRRQFDTIIQSEAVRWNPKSVFRSWFYLTQMRYYDTGRRAIRCDAGSGFFYMDSFGEIYLCHIIPHKIGNLARRDFEELWNSPEAEQGRSISHDCNRCWMTCTAKSQLYQKLPAIGLRMATNKTLAHLGKKSFA
jgi:MoaA/NifB/PqqE/SkfB family radical SAM enzyme